MPIGLPKEQFEIIEKMAQGDRLRAGARGLIYEFSSGDNADSTAVQALLQKGIIKPVPNSDPPEFEFPGNLSDFSIEPPPKRPPRGPSGKRFPKRY
jgi:hypothetical protein